MSENYESKIYESLKIPDRQQNQGSGVLRTSQNKPAEPESPLSDGMFYEIEYDSHPIPGVGRFVRKPQQIERTTNSADSAEKDEIRALFDQMRDIARAYRSAHDYSRFFDRRVALDTAAIFYKQGMFMKDFSDNFPENAPFSQYYPYYQMMGYKQLRTYFTWRTEVRKGNVADTSLSYAFLYIYELLSNIGVNDPQEGLEKLMFFWKAFRTYNKAIDRYVLKWLKDYHIYYELPLSFKEFVKENNLTDHYPGIVDSDDTFDLFCAVSKYDIRKSTFFTDDKKELIIGCFNFVTCILRQIFIEIGTQFDSSIFQPTKRLAAWTPFGGALFYDWLRQRDRKIVLSENEIYVCSQNRWAYSTVITSESGRHLIGYVMKQMEAALRKVTKYKYKLSANINNVTHPVVNKLKDAGLSLEGIINDAVAEYYREATKTVVKVDFERLSIIREEALVTQEKLTVEEQEALGSQEEQADQEEQMDQEEHSFPVSAPSSFPIASPQDVPVYDDEPAPVYDEWEGLKNALTETETEALRVVLHGEMGIKKFADECGIMLEVLADGINEKAMDYIGDSLLDEDFILYDDYIDHVKEMVG